VHIRWAPCVVGPPRGRNGVLPYAYVQSSYSVCDVFFSRWRPESDRTKSCGVSTVLTLVHIDCPVVLQTLDRPVNLLERALLCLAFFYSPTAPSGRRQRQSFPSTPSCFRLSWSRFFVIPLRPARRHAVVKVKLSPALPSCPENYLFFSLFSMRTTLYLPGDELFSKGSLELLQLDGPGIPINRDKNFPRNRGSCFRPLTPIP